MNPEIEGLIIAIALSFMLLSGVLTRGMYIINVNDRVPKDNLVLFILLFCLFLSSLCSSAVWCGINNLPIEFPILYFSSTIFCIISIIAWIRYYIKLSNYDKLCVQNIDGV